MRRRGRRALNRCNKGILASLLRAFLISIHTGMRASAQFGLTKGYVFLNTKGGWLLDARFEPSKSRGAEPAAEKAGLEDYTWHCNRHTFASWLVMAGVAIRTVAQLMGHRTIQMTMRYAHLAPDHNRRAVDRLASFSREVAATKSATGPSRSSRTTKKM